MLNLTRRADGGLEPFKTPRHAYTFIAPGSAMTVRRWTEYEKLNIVFGFNRTFSQLYEAVTNVERLAASDKPFPDIRRELILQLNALKTGLVEESKTRYNHAFYVCTIFVLQDDQKPNEWSLERAESIIEDWAEAGVSEQDLFFFALNASSGIKAALLHEREAIRERTARLSGLGGYPETESLKDT